MGPASGQAGYLTRNRNVHRLKLQPKDQACRGLRARLSPDLRKGASMEQRVTCRPQPRPESDQATRLILSSV